MRPGPKRRSQAGGIGRRWGLALLGLCGAVLATGCGREEGPQLREWRLPATDSYPVVGQVTAIASGRGGEVWFTTLKNGVSRYAGGLWRNFNKADGLPEDGLHGVLPARDGAVWFSTTKGVIRYDRDEQGEHEHWTAYTTADVPTLPSDDVRSMHQSSSADGTIWFGTSSKGLCSYHPRDGWRGYNIDPLGATGPRSGAIRAISDDGAGGVWFGSADGISIFTPAAGALADGVAAQAQVPEGAKKAGGAGNWRELRFEGDVLRPDRLLGNEIRYLRRRPGDDHIWIATGYGVSRYDVKSRTLQSLPPISIVSALLPDVDAATGQSRVWIGGSTASALLFEPESGTWQHHSPGRDFTETSVNAMWRDRDGTLWFGTNQGLWMYAPSGAATASGAASAAPVAPAAAAVTGTSGTSGGWRRVDSDQPRPVILSLLRTHSGELWVGTATGILACSGTCEKWNNPSNVQTLRRAAVYALTESSDGVVWIASDAGVHSYDLRRSRLTSHNTALKLPRRSVVYDAAIDGNGTIWFASDVGVPTLNPRTGETHAIGEATTRRGAVRRIVWDSQGDQYLVSPDRIVRVPRGSKGRDIDLTQASQLISVRVATVAADGSVWFGGQNGLARYQPRGDRFTTYFALNNVQSIGAEKGGVWLGFTDGAVRYADGATTCFAALQAASTAPTAVPAASCQRVTVSDTPANQRTVTSVLVDDKEVVWLGTLHGIRRARRERGDLAPARPSDPSWSGAAGSMGGAVDAAPASATLSSAGAGMVQVGGLDRVLSRELSRVFRDSRGDTWFAFAGSGLARLDAGGTWTAVTVDGPAPVGAFVQDIFEDRDGRMWFASEDRGIAVYEPSTSHWQVLTTQDGLLDNKAYAVRQTVDGVLWLATAGGVNSVSPDLRSWAAHPLETLRLFVGPLLLAIHDDRYPVLLEGNGRALARYSGQAWQPLLLPSSESEEITAMESDRHGAVWFGTRHGGLFRLGNDGGWTHSDLGGDGGTDLAAAGAYPREAKAKAIGQLAKLSNLYQQVAAGGLGGGAGDSGSEPVVGILRDERGEIWVVTDDNDKPGGFRLYHQEGRRDSVEPYTPGGRVYRGDNAFRPLSIDASGVLWGAGSISVGGVNAVGVRSGGARGERRLVRAVLPSATAQAPVRNEVGAFALLPATPSKQIIVTPDALIQVRGARQLVKYFLDDGERPRGEPLAQEVSFGTTITDLARGPEGRVWVATDTGGLVLRRLERDQPAQDIQLAGRLPSLSVTSLAPARPADPRQGEGCTLWVATSGGVAYVSVCALSGTLLNKESWFVRTFDPKSCPLPPGPVERLAVDRDTGRDIGRVVLAYSALDASRFATEEQARKRAYTRFWYIDYDADKDAATCRPLAEERDAGAAQDSAMGGPAGDRFARNMAESRRRLAVGRAQVHAMAYSSKREVGLYAATSGGLLFSPDIERQPVRVVAGEGRLPPMPVAALAISPDRFSTVWLATMQQGDTPPYVLGYRPNSQWIYVLTQEQGVPLGPSIDGLGFTRDLHDPTVGVLVVAVGNRLARGAAFVVDDGPRSPLVRLLLMISIAGLTGLLLLALGLSLTVRHPLVVKLRARPQALVDELPLVALPVALRRLRMARALPEVFTQLGLPRERARAMTALSGLMAGTAPGAEQLRALAALLGMRDVQQATVQVIPTGKSGGSGAGSILILAARLPHPDKLSGHPTAIVGLSAAALQPSNRRALYEQLRTALSQVGHPEPHPFLLLTGRVAQAATAANVPLELPLHLAIGEAELRALLFSPDPSRRLAGLLHARRLLTSSPYSHEGDVKSAAMFVGREGLLRDLVTSASPQAIMVGPRRVGKTSFLKRLAQALRLNRPEFDVHFLDLLGIKTYADAENALRVVLETARFEAGAASSSGSFVQAACQVGAMGEAADGGRPEAPIVELIRARHRHTGRRVVLLIDEGDGLVKTDAERDHPLLNALRALQAQDICAIVLAGYLYLYRQALDQRSPLYNFARVLLLGPLQQSEAVELATRPMALLSVRYADPELPRRIAADTGGYPSFVQLLCDQMLSELKQDDLVLTVEHLRAAEDSQRVYDQLVTMLKMNTRRLTQILIYALLGQDRFSAVEAHQALGRALERQVPFSIVEQALTELRVFSLLLATTEGESTTYTWGIPLLRAILRASEPDYALAGLIEELQDGDLQSVAPRMV